MIWFLKFLKYLPKAMLAFRNDYKLSKRCEKIEKKEGPIAGAIYMYPQLIEELRPHLIGDLLSWVESTNYQESNLDYACWLNEKGVQYGFIETLTEVSEVESQTKEAWKEWEMQE